MFVANPDQVETKYSMLPFFFYLIIFFGISVAGIIVDPSLIGIGTHERLGLPPCGFFTLTGFPCPSCGLTTSFSHFLHGHFQASFMVQPFGFIFYITLFALAGISLYAIARKIPFCQIIGSDYFEKGQFILLLFFIASWIYKIMAMKDYFA